MPRLNVKTFLWYWFPVILWLSVILVESTSSLSSDNTAGIVIPILHWLFPTAALTELQKVHDAGRKVGHFVGYGLMGYFFFRAVRGMHHVLAGTESLLRKGMAAGAGVRTYFRLNWALSGILGTAIVASADEIHQTFLPSRGGHFHDVVLDTSGAVIVLLFVWIVARRRSRASSCLAATQTAK